MTIPLYCLFAGIVLPYVWATASSVARKQQLGKIDNKLPRAQQAVLTGWGARAQGAQQNAWEALAVFTAAVVISHLAEADPVWCGRLALGWVGLRVAHGIAYIADADIVRSVIFTVGSGCAVAMVLLAIIK